MVVVVAILAVARLISRLSAGDAPAVRDATLSHDRTPSDGPALPGFVDRSIGMYLLRRIRGGPTVAAGDAGPPSLLTEDELAHRIGSDTPVISPETGAFPVAAVPTAAPPVAAAAPIGAAATTSPPPPWARRTTGVATMARSSTHPKAPTPGGRSSPASSRVSADDRTRYALALPPLPLENRHDACPLARVRRVDRLPVHDLSLHLALKRAGREHGPGEVSDGFPARSKEPVGPRRDPRGDAQAPIAGRQVGQCA